MKEMSSWKYKDSECWKLFFTLNDDDGAWI